MSGVAKQLRGGVGGVLIFACALATVPAVVGEAKAQTPADVAAARDLFREGSQLAQEEKWDQARARFEQSLSLRRAAITLYSLGVAQKKTARFAESLESLRAFVQWPPNAATDPYVPVARSMITELEGKIGRVTISVKPPEARLRAVTVDGVAIGNVALEMSRIVNPGAHVVRITGENGKEGAVSVTVASGETRAIAVELRPTTVEIVDVASGKATHGTDVAPTSSVTVPPAEPPARSRTVSVVLMSGGAALLIGGGVVGALALSQARSSSTSSGPDADGARHKALAADVLGGVGVVALGVGAYLYWSSPRAEGPSAALRLGPGSFALEGRF